MVALKHRKNRRHDSSGCKLGRCSYLSVALTGQQMQHCASSVVPARIRLINNVLQHMRAKLQPAAAERLITARTFDLGQPPLQAEPPRSFCSHRWSLPLGAARSTPSET